MARMTESAYFIFQLISMVRIVTGHFVFCSAGGQGSELTNDNLIVNIKE